VTDVDDITSAEDLVRQNSQELRRAKEAIAGPVPLITLPLGLYVNGVHKKVVQLRELTGVDEEMMAKAKDPADFFDLVIALGTVSVDDFDMEKLAVVERQGWLRSLLVGERDQLFMAVARATFGDTREVGFTCSVCNEKQEITLILSEDFKPKEVDLDSETYEFTTSRGDTLIYRLVTGDDQREALARKGATTAEQNTILLSRCILKLNNGLVVDPLAYVRSLSIRDRGLLLDSLVNKQPSVDLGVTTNCAICGSEQTLPLRWGDIFRN
jgi:hypothetical protein